MSKRILLSGFEPFGTFETNPSWDALALAQSEGLLGDHVSIVKIPVTYTDAFDVFAEAFEAHQPEGAISFGVYGSRLDSASFQKANDLDGKTPASSCIYIESVARNRDNAGKPDNAGVTREGGVIVADAPETIAASFPADSLRHSLKEAGYDCEISEDAGGYLCNHLFYRGMHAFGARIPYGFVHVPPVVSMNGSLTLQQLAQAMADMANTLAKYSGS